MSYSMTIPALVFSNITPLIGIASLVISHIVYATFYNEIIVKFLGDDLRWIPIVMMVLGGLLVFITFLGGFGAMKESSTMVFIFLGVSIAIFVFNLAIVITFFTKSNKSSELKTKLQNKFMFNETETAEENYAIWYFLQTRMSCCGIEGATDWLIDDNSTFYGQNSKLKPNYRQLSPLGQFALYLQYLTPFDLPHSCCDIQPGILMNCTSVNALNGCSGILNDEFNTVFLNLLAVELLIFVAHLISIAFAIHWLVANRNNYADDD